MPPPSRRAIVGTLLAPTERRKQKCAVRQCIVTPREGEGMNINVRLTRIIIVLGLLFSVPACKLVITVPEGGTVESLSGAYSCDAGQTCTIDVVDTFFDESFTARAVPRKW